MVYVNYVKMTEYLMLVQKFEGRLVSHCQTQLYIYNITISYKSMFQSCWIIFRLCIKTTKRKINCKHHVYTLQVSSHLHFFYTILNHIQRRFILHLSLLKMCLLRFTLLKLLKYKWSFKMFKFPHSSRWHDGLN